MCTAAELLASVTLLLLLPLGVLALVDTHRFIKHLRTAHPGIWETLGKRGKWMGSEDPHYAAVHWYLVLGGQYKQIDDPKLHELGGIARSWMLGFFALASALGILINLTHASASFRCLLP